jgi:uncharacterized membrane protein YfcA
MADVSLLQYAVIAATAFVASVIGGVAGYGTGLLMPLVLVPIIGPVAVVPVISVSALFTNSGRVLAFRNLFNRQRAIVLVLSAVPTCIVGAYLYTLLSGPAVAVLIGVVLVLLVPGRRRLMRLEGHLSGLGLVLAGMAYGLLVGGTSGSGVVLLAILLASGLEGRAVIATDAGVTFVIGLAKTAVFQSAGALPPALWIVALVIGGAALPGAFIAKRLTDGLSAKSHTAILDAVVVVGGLLLIAQGVRTLLA